MQETYLFDTDTITNVVKKNPSHFLVQKLKDIPFDSQYITTLTIGEIVYGAMKSLRPEFHLKKLKEIILPSVNIIGFDSRAAFQYGQIRAYLEKKGTPIGHVDMQIAAIAQVNQFILITGNIKHFNRVPDLQVENWIK